MFSRVSNTSAGFLPSLLVTGLLAVGGLHAGEQERDGMLYDINDVSGIEHIVERARTGTEPWRVAARERIETHRKTDLWMRVLDHQGAPVRGARVHITLNRHAFGFGGVLSATAVAGKTKGIDPDQYRAAFLALFNRAGFNNALKYKLKRGHEALVPPILAWLRENEIPVRGHTLMWPGWDHMHRDAVKLKADHEALRAFCDHQIVEYAQKWDVVEWDVINEPRANHDLQDIFGQEIMVHWFKLAARNAKNPDAGLYLNENRVISAPSGRERFIDIYRGQVAFLLENGAPLSGLGFQSRFKWDCPPEEMLRRLRLFDEYELPISATEFEIVDGRETKWSDITRAEMTERVMTVYFSHPLVSSIMAWTLYDSNPDSPSGLLRSDGTLKPNGGVWLHLTRKLWHTDENRTTGREGTVHVRAFLGRYRYVVTDGTRKTTGTFEVGPKGAKRTLRLPAPTP